MSLSDAGMRRRQTKMLYPNHRPTPLAHRSCGPSNRSNRWLGGASDHAVDNIEK
jgi:hypothetical protein